MIYYLAIYSFERIVQFLYQRKYVARSHPSMEHKNLSAICSNITLSNTALFQQELKSTSEK